jgi:predicted RND superfamily exporter protein
LFNVLTTSAGMGSLAFATIPPMQVFGLAGALGSLTVFLMVYLIVPPILLRWDIPRWPRRSSGMSHARHVAARMTFFSMRHAKTILIVTVLFIIASVPLIMNVKVETDMIKFFSPNHPMTIGTKRLEEKLSGITTMEVVFTGTGRDSLKDPDTLKRIESLQNWIKSLPEVDHAFSMVDVIKRMNRAFNGDAPSFDTLPSDRKLIEQYLLIYDGKDLYENVNREYQRGLMVVNLHVHGAQEVSHVIRAIQDHIQTSPIPGIQVQMSGFGKLFSDQVKMIVDSQVNSFSGAFIQIFLLMALLWRSIPSAIISLIPNLVPLFFIFVLMGATGIYLDVATALIAGVVLGITVDDTIHLYHGYLHRRKKGISAVFSIARSFESSGRAVLAVSVILVAQFLLLTLSDYNPTMHFGLLCAIGLASGQIFEMLLMPALMVWKDVKPGRMLKAQ